MKVDWKLCRVWWIFAFGLSAFACGSLIRNVWIKWDQSPVIVSFAEKSTPGIYLNSAKKK